MQRSYSNATLLSALAVAVLCVPILQSNTNDHQCSVSRCPVPWATRSPVMRFPPVTRESTQGLQFAEVSLVPISPEDLEAELRDWARNDYLYGLVSKEVRERDRRDIAHESWCRVRERPPDTINDLASLRGYGAKVVHTVTVDFIYGRRRAKPIIERKGSHGFVEQKCIEAGKVADAPDEECDQQQREEQLARAIATLPPRQRHTLELFHLEDLPAEEVARRQGVAVSTVYNVVKKVIRQLMTKVRKFERDDGPRRDKK